MVQQLVQLLNENNPGILHKCPYTVRIVKLTPIETVLLIWNFKEINLKNCTASLGSAKAIFPSGEYKIIDTIFHGNDTLGQTTAIAVVTSSDKNVFG